MPSVSSSETLRSKSSKLTTLFADLLTVCIGLCAVLTVLPAWIVWHTAVAVSSLTWHLVGKDAAAISLALLHHEYVEQRSV